MNNYSSDVKIAWEISCYEAANKNSAYIEVDHILLGILSLNKIKQDGIFQNDEDYKRFLHEKKGLYNTLNIHGISTTTFRRKLREILPTGTGLPLDNVFHRSEDCKNMFAHAALFATKFLTINHLFLSIIEWETSYSRALLIAEKIDLEKLKSEIMFSFYRRN
jgi:ATP-dependent Clp protease ATP-binding subunit ClpC